MLWISCLWLPPGKSVRPTESAKSVSPVKITTFFFAYRQIPPGVWPGVWKISRLMPAISIASPASISTSAGVVLNILPASIERFFVAEVSIFASSV